MHRTALEIALPEAGAEGGIQDVGELYRVLAGRLERIVRTGVRSSDAVVEDACQFAWSRLVHHRDRVREETVLGWLAKTAIREALKLSRRGARELSLEDAVARGIDPVALEPEPWELLLQREQVAAIRGLCDRQQRMLWLRGLGLSYSEMANHERCTQRVVERELFRARRCLRAASRDVIHARPA